MSLTFKIPMSTDIKCNVTNIQDYSVHRHNNVTNIQDYNVHRHEKALTMSQT